MFFVVVGYPFSDCLKGTHQEEIQLWHRKGMFKTSRLNHCPLAIAAAFRLLRIHQFAEGAARESQICHCPANAGVFRCAKRADIAGWNACSNQSCDKSPRLQ